MAAPAKKLEEFSNAEVLQHLQANGLGALCAAFEENEVTGLDLVLLTEDEMRTMLQITKIQAMKVRQLVDAATADGAADGSDGTAAAAAGDPDAAGDAGEAEARELSASGAQTPPCDGAAVAAVAAAAAGEEDEDEKEAAGHFNEDLARATSVTVTKAAAVAPATYPTVAAATGTTTVTATLTAVGVPAAAPGAPLLPPGTGALQLDPGTVSRYQTAMATISAVEREGAAQALPAARTRLAAARQRLKLQQQQFEVLRKEEAKDNEKLQKLEDGKWYPGKYLLGSKRREQKLEGAREQAASSSNKVRAVAAQLEELHAEVNTESNRVSELVARCAALDEARSFCAELLERTFGGMGAGDARENELELEVAQLGPKLAEVRRYKTVYGQAHESMRAASRALDQALQLLQAASGMATLDVAGNFMRPRRVGATPGSLMVDMVKRSQMRQGVQLCRVAADHAIKARALIPDMPRVKAEKLQQLRVGFGLFDVVFDNMISDMIVFAKIRGMLSKARDVQQDVVYAERWLQGWISGRINQDLAALESKLAAKRTELHTVRTQLMQAWIDARARGAVAEAPVPRPVPLVVAGVPVQGYVL